MTSPAFTLPLAGPDGGKPTLRQVANRLLKTFAVLDAYEFFHDYCLREATSPEAIKSAWSEELASKDVWESREVKPPATAKPAPINSLELDDLQLPAPQWIINKVIPVGSLVAISGVPGSYKSFFALWLALRAANGLPLFDALDTPFFAEQGTKLTPTLFIEEENTLPLVYHRHRSLKTPRSANLFFHIDQGFKLADEAWLTSIKAFIQEKGIKLIVMDPFSSVMGFEDENNNAEVAVKMDLMRKTFLMEGVTVLFLHHPSKNSEGGTNLRGAGDILGKCDVHLHLEKDEIDKQLVTVSYKKMRLIAETEVANFKMRATGDGGIGQLEFRYLGESQKKSEAEREGDMKKILELFIGTEQYTKKDISDGLSLTKRRFDIAWAKLLEEKLIGHPYGSRQFVRKGGEIT